MKMTKLMKFTTLTLVATLSLGLFGCSKTKGEGGILSKKESVTTNVLLNKQQLTLDESKKISVDFLENVYKQALNNGQNPKFVLAETSKILLYDKNKNGIYQQIGDVSTSYNVHNVSSKAKTLDLERIYHNLYLNDITSPLNKEDYKHSIDIFKIMGIPDKDIDVIFDSINSTINGKGKYMEGTETQIALPSYPDNMAYVRAEYKKETKNLSISVWFIYDIPKRNGQTIYLQSDYLTKVYQAQSKKYDDMYKKVADTLKKAGSKDKEAKLEQKDNIVNFRNDTVSIELELSNKLESRRLYMGDIIDGSELSYTFRSIATDDSKGAVEDLKKALKEYCKDFDFDNDEIVKIVSQGKSNSPLRYFKNGYVVNGYVEGKTFNLYITGYTGGNNDKSLLKK